MAQAENGYRPGMGAATGNQHLFVPYVYRGNGPYIRNDRGGPRHGTIGAWQRHKDNGERPCDQCEARYGKP